MLIPLIGNPRSGCIACANQYGRLWIWQPMGTSTLVQCGHQGYVMEWCKRFNETCSFNGFLNNISTIKQHFALPLNESKYYLKYTSKAAHILGILEPGTSLGSITQMQISHRVNWGMSGSVHVPRC